MIDVVKFTQSFVTNFSQFLVFVNTPIKDLPLFDIIPRSVLNIFGDLFNWSLFNWWCIGAVQVVAICFIIHIIKGVLF